LPSASLRAQALATGINGHYDAMRDGLTLPSGETKASVNRPRYSKGHLSQPPEKRRD
jgi:hypothetical protein